MTDKTDYIDNIKYLKDNLNRMMLYGFVKKSIFDSPVFSGIKPSTEEPIEKINLVLRTKDLSLKDYVSLDDYLNLLDKRELLRSNIFRLLSLQENLNSNSFNFLVSEYKKFLEDTIKKIDKLNRDNKYTDLKNSDIIIKYLDLQQELLNSHLEEINNKFFPPIFNWKLPKSTIPIQESKSKLKDLIIKGNAEAIEKVLINEFKNSNNITINRMFTALSSLGYIIDEYGNKKKLIECLNNSIGSEKYISRLVFINKINVYNDKKYIQLRTKISNLLEKL